MTEPQQHPPGQGHPAVYHPIPRTAAPLPPPGWPPRHPTQFLAQVPLRPDYARWRRRVAAALIDSTIGIVGSIVLLVGYVQYLLLIVRDTVILGDPPEVALHGPLVTVGVGAALWFVDLLWGIYNRWLLAGRTGQSVGKRAMKIWLVGRETNRPIGPLNAFVRDLVHVIDSQYYLGYLWPIWDAERQTFADKIVSTVVVTTAVAPLEPGRTP